MEIASNDVRRSVTYHPSVWGDYFLAYTSQVTEISVAEKEEHEKQREEIRNLVQQTGDDSTQKLDLIDSIQRLGVAYHFQKEIDSSLRYIYDNHTTKNVNDQDIRVVALRFRLLRQQGFPVPCDVFSKFLDEEGKFKESIMKDVEGMLNLYEASNFGIEGEEILEKALEFSSSGLESSIRGMDNSVISRRVKDALKIPIRKTLTRLGARKFISMYEEDSHKKALILNFAKLEFNIVQKIHQKELSHLTRWWKEIEFANKLPFARDRLVECYFWIVGVFFEPRHGVARKLLTKVIYLGSYLDDIYDVFGTLDELTLYTAIIRRWDINAVEELPAYMGIHYKALLDVYVEMDEEMGKIGKSYAVEYAREEMKTMAEAYFQEAQWSFSNYKPSLDEYMKVALVSSGYTMLSVTGLTVIEDAISKEELDWVVSEPPLLRASLIITRLMDDLAGYRFEEKLSAVHYYVKEKGVSEAEAATELRKQVDRAWKDLNRECLEPRAPAAPIVSCVDNFTRVIALLYSDQDDAYGNSQNKTKHAIQSLLVHPLAL